MADTKKVEELQQAIAAAKAELEKLSEEQRVAGASAQQALNSAQAEYTRLKAAANSSNFGDLNVPGNMTAFKAARQASIDFKNNTLDPAASALDAATIQFNPPINSLRSGTIPNLERQLAEAQAAPAPEPAPEDTVKTPDATNPSQSDQKTADAYADPSRTPDPSVQTFDDGSSIQTFDDGSTLVTDSEGKLSSTESTDSSPRPALLSAAGTPISRGAESTKSKGASAQWGGAKDLRVYLRVPGSYLSGQYTSSLQEFAGIMFPYTPEISYDNQASYSAVNPVHTNYTQYFFKNSSVGPITVTGKFTVQNEKEAIIYLSVVHLLRSLTKMRWGSDEAPNAGAPPPVCRFEGYGDFMLRNVPVVLASFKTDFPNTVDYISVNSGAFKTSLVPTISSISLTLNPMYSRKEIQDFSVSGWLSGNLKGKGYL